MENRIKNIIIVINYVLLTAALIADAIINIESSVIIMLLYLIILAAYTIRAYFVFNTYEDKRQNAYDEKLSKLFLIATFLAECIAAVILQKYELYLISFVVFGTIIDDIVVNTKIKVSLWVTVAIYLLSCILFYFKFKNDNMIVVSAILLILPVYCIIYIIFYLINFLLKQNKMINKSLKDITIQNIEKDNLYKDLEEAYKKVEVITSLRERNRIAAEIHDTVGHTLTTVLVELEASKRLMKKDIEKSQEKLTLAQEQVRIGLNNIRSSVRVLEKGEDILDFFNSLNALIKETEKHSEVVIKSNIDNTLNISMEMRTVIYSAFIEGLSNGIRHGGSTAFIFKLKALNGKIIFSLEDNGKGAFVVSPGFGLRAMRARVNEINGTLETYSKEGEGFTLKITFPEEQG